MYRDESSVRRSSGCFELFLRRLIESSFLQPPRENWAKKIVVIVPYYQHTCALQCHCTNNSLLLSTNNRMELCLFSEEMVEVTAERSRSLLVPTSIGVLIKNPTNRAMRIILFVLKKVPRLLDGKPRVMLVLFASTITLETIIAITPTKGVVLVTRVLRKPTALRLMVQSLGHTEQALNVC
jgi:hypothetical protein